MTPDQPTAPATPRTIEQAAHECADKIYPHVQAGDTEESFQTAIEVNESIDSERERAAHIIAARFRGATWLLETNNKTIEQSACECAEKIVPLFTRGSWSRQVKDTDLDPVALVITATMRKAVEATMRKAVERELSSAQAELDTYKAREVCVVCHTAWNPSLIESGECVFCTLKKAKAEVDTLTKRTHERREVAQALLIERDQLRARVAELEQDKARHLTILKEAHEKIQTYAKRQGKTRMAGKSFGDGTKRNPQVGQHYPAIRTLLGSINTAIDAAKAQP